MRRLLLVVSFLIFVTISSSAQLWVISTYAGGGPNNANPTGATIEYPKGISTDAAGNL